MKGKAREKATGKYKEYRVDFMGYQIDVMAHSTKEANYQAYVKSRKEYSQTKFVDFVREAQTRKCRFSM